MHTISRSSTQATVARNVDRTQECLSSYQIAMASLGVMSISVSLTCSGEGAGRCASQFASDNTAISNTADQAGLCAWQIRQLAAYIDMHIHTAIRTIDLAQALGLSVSHFSRAFKRACGMTPREFILRKRVAHACQAMRQSESNLTEIAHTLGFYDQSHFTRVFKKLSGQSPQAWRKQECVLEEVA